MFKERIKILHTTESHVSLMDVNKNNRSHVVRRRY